MPERVTREQQESVRCDYCADTGEMMLLDFPEREDGGGVTADFVPCPFCIERRQAFLDKQAGEARESEE